jgi:acyl-CoA synthetase (AMP-forming)/AMP-acid ligase II
MSSSSFRFLPAACRRFWNADERFRSAYLDEFPGYYKTADAGYIDGDGYLFIMSRTDDIINCAGHRLSTGAMEEVCAMHPDVAECAVVGIADPLKGQVPCGFLVLKKSVSRETSAIEREVVALIRAQIGPVAAFKTAITVEAATENPLGQDPAWYDAEDRRRRALEDAGNDRRSRYAGGNSSSAAWQRVRDHCPCDAQKKPRKNGASSISMQYFSTGRRLRPSARTSAT